MMTGQAAQAVFFTAPESVVLQSLQLPPLAAGQVLLKTRYSAISAGTESLIFRGQFPASGQQDVNIASLQGSFDYPFQYGYALTGEIIEVAEGVTKDWLGKRVFAFHPHQDYAVVTLQDCWLIPDEMSLEAALFLPNVESALNFVMDAAPLIGEQVMVIGQGVVGLLTTRILADFPLAALIGVEPLAYRREVAQQIGAVTANPNDPVSWQRLLKQVFSTQQPGIDLAIELSGSAQGLNQALSMTGFGGRIILASWYGDKPQSLHLGADFHRRRIQLLSSQVSSLNPKLTGRWDKARRMRLAWRTIQKIHPEKFISHRFAAAQCQQAFELANRRYDGALQVILEY